MPTANQRAKNPAKSNSPDKKKFTGFTKQEQKAMRERAQELKAESRVDKDREAGEKALLEKIAQMPEPDQTMAKQIHTIVKANAPTLLPKTWYGMPAYANKEGKVVCFFQDANKFKARYATLGFSDTANLDEGNMWPTSFALKKLTSAEEIKITALVKKAAKS